MDFYLALQKGQNEICGYSAVQQILPIKHARMGTEKEPREAEDWGRCHKCFAGSAGAGKG